jgi:hypothetical protein
MNKTISLLLIIISFLALFGCSGLDPLSIIKSNSQVKDFLDRYPNADVTLVKLNAESVESENLFVKEICDVLLAKKDHYKAEIFDSETDLKLYVYIEKDTQDIICLKKIGKEIEEEKEFTKEHDEFSKEKEHVEEKNDECNKDIELVEYIHDNKVTLKWDKYLCDDFKGYKVVWSETVKNPKYPENSYIEYITDKSKTYFEDKVKKENNYYSITVLTIEGYVYSNSVYIEYEETEPEENCDLNLRGYVDEDMGVIKWTPCEYTNFKGYKIVQSSNVENPRYPKDGYIKYILDYKEDELEVNLEKGKNYFGITIILTDGSKKYSNFLTLEYKEKVEVENTEINYSINLEHELNNESLELFWNSYEGNDFEYYKIVWSTENSNLMYPEDGYIKYISDKENSEFLVSDLNFVNGTNYYRISAIFSDYYTNNNDPNKRINSNVLEVVK